MSDQLDKPSEKFLPKFTVRSPLPILSEVESRYIEFVLSQEQGNKTATARVLGINRRTLYRRLDTIYSRRD